MTYQAVFIQYIAMTPGRLTALSHTLFFHGLFVFVLKSATIVT